MNATMTWMIWTVFDGVILVIGIYLVIAGNKMKKTKEISTLVLNEDEMKNCRQKEAFAEFFGWREALMGALFVVCGAIRLLDRFVLKIGGILDIGVMIALLVTSLWLFKSLQTARAKFLS